MRSLWPVLYLLALPVSTGAVLTKEQAAMSLGQTYTANFYAGDMASIWQHMTRQMREALGSEGGLRDFGNKVEHDVGSDLSGSADRGESVAGFRPYTRQSKFSTIKLAAHFLRLFMTDRWFVLNLLIFFDK